MEGNVAHDGHLYGNDQWTFVKMKRSTLGTRLVDKWPDRIILPMQTRATLSRYPKDKADKFPPQYKRTLFPRREKPEGAVPVITMGRYGTLLRRKRPSDDAFKAMLGSAKTIIHLAIQDLGPFCIPGTKITLPGCVWPQDYMKILAKVIWEKDVQVEIALSNPQSIPGDLSPLEAVYGNGWTCIDVAAEIIGSIKKHYPKATDEDFRRILQKNLRVCFIREKLGNSWQNGKTMGMHAKHFIVDDILFYIGSQNLYVCDLAEWGVAIDDEAETKRIMAEYWNPLWKASYKKEDCEVDAVMAVLDIDRSGDKPNAVSKETKNAMKEAAAKQQAMKSGVGRNQFYDKSGVEKPDLRSSIISAAL